METIEHHSWNNLATIIPRDYTCGHCGRSVAPDKGYQGRDSNSMAVYIYICHKCGRPTLFDREGNQSPGAKYGDSVEHVPDETNKLYEEARNCIGANSPTAAVLCCRKILMHIAVDKGADENKSFKDYVDFLSQKNYISSEATNWVDHIRKMGNDANHEITLMDTDVAKDLLTFVEHLLKSIYEFPKKLKPKTP